MRKVDATKHQKKRQEILQAAGRCFGRDGFSGASISDICAEAKISPGHLYHYFASKEAIVEAMVEGNLVEAAERFSRIADETDIVTAIALVIEQLKAPRVRSASFVFFDVLAEAGRNPTMAKILQDLSRRMRELLAAVLRNGQARGQVDPDLDAEMAAAILMAVVDGSKMLAMRHPKLDKTESVELLKVLVARFLAPPTSAPRK
jgi:TetR/AcrR family transcriptional regulator, repressor for uid operon